MSTRWPLRIVAVLCVLVALTLVVLAIDVLRLPGKLEGGDVRFDAAPRRAVTPWSRLDLVRGWPAARLLDVSDDLAYRRTMKKFVSVQPGRTVVFGPKLENLRGIVLRDLTTGSAQDSNPRRRSQYMNLSAAMMLEQYAGSPTERDALLRRAIYLLRDAVYVDPENADAKVNLELALRDAKAVNLPGTDPDTGRADGTLSGEGRSGSGY